MEFKYKKLILNSLVLFASLSLSWWILKSAQFQNVLEIILPVRFLGDFLAGLFYTSFLTSPISLAMLVVLAEDSNPIFLALIAGLGAALGDFLIVKLFRERLNKEFKEVTHHKFVLKVDNFLAENRLGFVKQALGIIIIASPFPDEIGLFLLGASTLKYKDILIITYVLNTVGILLFSLPFSLL